ncbi:glutathione S-transferase T3 [Artemisia annua]|uniref:Glutathione S-transferase T3 n=1 Tax=Artemisia annua TaxID=35608 RepID=A0A2U1NY95_ARTAN|nr:glutathione S-transferase T3 [Artemisia annua]
MSSGYQGSRHRSYHDSVLNDDLVGDDDDNTISEEMSLVKPKKRATKGKKKAVEKDTANDSAIWTKKEDITFCMAWCDSSEDSIVGTNQNSKGFWKKVITYFENEELSKHKFP